MRNYRVFFKNIFCSGAPLDIKNLYNLDNAARLTISEVCLNPKIRSKSNHDRKPIQGCRNIKLLIQKTPLINSDPSFFSRS